MRRYQNIMICIGDPQRDHSLVSCAAPISQASQAQEIHLVHVEPAREEGTPELPGESDQGVTSEKLDQLAREHFKGHGSEKIICRSLNGQPLYELLRYAMDHEIDLIVVGKHPDEQAGLFEGILAERITRKATCTVLVMPPDCTLQPRKILAPVRDSDCSAHALETACAFAEQFKATICALNVFQVHSGYSSVGTTLEEHTELMYRWAVRDCENLIERIDTRGVEIQTRCVADLYAQPVPIILDELQKENADTIVIGARGRTGAAGVLLGAVTERLIQQSNVPVLAVKKKGECIGVLKALLSLA